MRTSVIVDPLSGREQVVSRLGMGCSRVGSLGNPVGPKALRALMERALDLGVCVFDTADIYGQGDSEREIGRALRRRRGEAFVITKFGKRFSPAMRLIRPLKPVIKPLLRARGASSAVTARRDGVMREDFTPERLELAFEASLRRLRFDYVDAVLLHGPPTSIYADAGVRALLIELQASGRVRHFGASCETWDDVGAALAIPGLSVLQLPLDLSDRLWASELGAEAARRGVAVFIREAMRLQPQLAPAAAVRTAAERPGPVCVIAGMSRQKHLDELVGVCS